MKIGVDIDNTIAALMEGFCDYYEMKYGRKMNVEDFDKYWLCEVLDIKKEEEYPLWKEYYDSDLFGEMELIENVREVIEFLKKDNEIIFITARNLDWKQKTLDFMEKHFPGHEFRILFSGDVYGGITKDKICGDLGISVIIEDHHEKSLDYAKAGMKVILLEQPWNRKIGHDNIIRIKNWKEVPGVLERIKK